MPAATSTQSRLPTLQQLLVEHHLKIQEPIFSSSRCCILSAIDSQNQPSVLKVKPAQSLEFKKENEWLLALSHPNIVRRKGIIQNEQYSILELEKIDGLALIDDVKKNGPLSEDHLKTILRQLISVFDYLHSKRLVYLDLKPDNMMYNRQTQKLTLIDFEHVMPVPRWRSHKISLGTKLYYSPEMERGAYKGPECEMWSLGLTLFVLAMGSFPEWKEVQSDKVKGAKGAAVVRVDLPEKLSIEFRDLLVRLLEIDGKKRASLRTVRTHPWIKARE